MLISKVSKSRSMETKIHAKDMPGANLLIVDYVANIHSCCMLVYFI